MLVLFEALPVSCFTCNSGDIQKAIREDIGLYEVTWMLFLQALDTLPNNYYTLSVLVGTV